MTPEQTMRICDVCGGIHTCNPTTHPTSEELSVRCQCGHTLGQHGGVALKTQCLVGTPMLTGQFFNLPPRCGCEMFSFAVEPSDAK